MKNSFGITERRCKISDYQFAKSIYQKTTICSKNYEEMLPSFKFRFHRDWKRIKILMKGKGRIGFYQILEDPEIEDALYIRMIFLSPSYQGKGIGNFLMESFEKLGYKKLRLLVWDNNPSLNFYKKLGYKVVAKNNHKYTMEKTI